MDEDENDAARQARFERLDKEALMRTEAKYDARLKSRFEDRGWSVRVKSQAVSDDEFVF